MSVAACWPVWQTSHFPFEWLALRFGAPLPPWQT